MQFLLKPVEHVPFANTSLESSVASFHEAAIFKHFALSNREDLKIM